MHADSENLIRPILEEDPPRFLDRVNTPWDSVPDLEDYNRQAYVRIERALKEMVRSKQSSADANAQGILILGEAGTGKTHLLMRVAKNLSESNHVLFIRKPNNEEAVAQHIWANVVNSLTKTLPSAISQRSQLDDLLAHVFSAVLIPEFQKDVEEHRDADQKRRWANRLQDDPYHLFNMLGEGERRQDNLRSIRRRTLTFLQQHQPDVDQKIAHALITYCLITRDDRKRVLLSWLSGQDIDETEARDLGLSPTWVNVTDDSGDVSTQQQREEQSLRAIRTIGILSTYYQPLILAFDQLEGLRDQERLTTRWGDVVREIFTMAPNYLVITCIFPSLWETWFQPHLDQSVTERIAQQQLVLETFRPQHGMQLLAAQLEPSFVKHRLPTSIYPFTEQDVAELCSRASSPRTFIQQSRILFETWLDGAEVSQPALSFGDSAPVTQERIDAEIQTAMDRFEESQRASYSTEMVLEQDFFGRIRNLVEAIVSTAASTEFELLRATCAHYVMPPNLVLHHRPSRSKVCLAVMFSEGNAFAARMRNLNKCLAQRDQFDGLVIARDRRCKRLGPKSQEYVDDAQGRGVAYVQAGVDESTLINSSYETLVAIEEHDLAIGAHQIDKRQLVAFLRSHKTLNRSELFRHAGRQCPAFGEIVNSDATPGLPETAGDSYVFGPAKGTKPSDSIAGQSEGTSNQTQEKGQGVEVDVVIGDDALASPNVGTLGQSRGDARRIAISLTKPQCLVLLGYMGSGKSYALGVLMENALLSQQRLISQTRPMSVVAFNYRRNSQARFEYQGFAVPNSSTLEVQKLKEVYGGVPAAVGRVNVFAYHEEIPRRQSEYGLLRTLPVLFKPDELSAEHWEILMKPPTREAEYMDIIRDIIQKLYYGERLNFKNLENSIATDERMSTMQRRRAMNRLSFAQRWLSDDRPYEWTDVLSEGSLNIFDLRMQAMDAAEALKLCLIVTDLVRRTKNGVNKMIVFDEAHEYVDCKELVEELENSITQIRHDGLSFVLASQFPDRIPERIFKYLLTRLIFKLPNARAINYVRNAAPNLRGLLPELVANLGLEQGVCFLQTDDDCTDPLFRTPQAVEIRPRCTQHGGATVRQEAVPTSESETEGMEETSTELEVEDLDEESCPACGGELKLRRTNKGPRMICGNYPTCRYHRTA